MSPLGHLIVSFYPDHSFHIYFGAALLNVQRKIDAICRTEDRKRSYVIRQMLADGLGLDFKDDLLFHIRRVAEERNEKPGVLMRTIIEKALFG